MRSICAGIWANTLNIVINIFWTLGARQQMPETRTPLNLDNIKPYQQRTFVPNDIDLSDVDAICAVFQILINFTINSQETVETFILNRSELEAVLNQYSSMLYIRMTCQTDNQEHADAYQFYTEKISPATKPLLNKLNQKYLAATKDFPQTSDRYDLYNLAIQTDIELFREENIELQTEVSLLSQEYQKRCGAMNVHFNGEERTMPEMGKYLLETDRTLRESAWRATSDRRLQDKDNLENIYDKMIQLRHTIATNCGFKNYRDYMFKAMHRFDYTPEHCYAFHDGIKNIIIPLLEKMVAKRKTNMGLDTLKPWDSNCDPFNRAPLEPFDSEEEFISGVSNIFKKIDPKLAAQFDKMNDLNLLDLMSRKGKAPGGYQSGLEEIRVPFIFMNAVGVDDNLRVLIHEGGHAFHSFAAADEPLVDYRHAPIEFCEVASMGMELLAIDHYTEFYEADEAKRSKEDNLESIITVLAWIATIDCFQHWIYENPTHTQEERKKKWLEIHNRFGGQFTDWENTGESHDYAWHRQLHLFECPFYYIEYGIAQLGALGLWVQSKANKENALKNYHNGLSLGGSKRLPELFQATGLPFDFSEKTIAPLAKALSEELGL